MDYVVIDGNHSHRCINVANKIIIIMIELLKLRKKKNFFFNFPFLFVKKNQNHCQARFDKTFGFEDVVTCKKRIKNA